MEIKAENVEKLDVGNHSGALLGEVAQRATELHDDKLDILMLRLNLYEMEGNTLCEKNKNRTRLIERLSENIKKENE